MAPTIGNERTERAHPDRLIGGRRDEHGGIGDQVGQEPAQVLRVQRAAGLVGGHHEQDEPPAKHSIGTFKQICLVTPDPLCSSCSCLRGALQTGFAAQGALL